MKQIKNYIIGKLVGVGFNLKNIFEYEQFSKEKLYSNLDSAEFAKNSDTVKKDQQGQLTNLTGDNVVTQNQVLAKTLTLNLRLIMRRETLESRLEQFDKDLYTENSPTDVIARIEEINADTGELCYFDIISKSRSDIGEAQYGKVEVNLTFACKTGINKRTETLTLHDLPVEGAIIEGA
ncbi:MAG: hypothetical protein GY754_11230 [bacterium]|nr:hypothetical protein [bacterium]